MGTWPEVLIDTEKDIDMCFGCGQSNPIGLKLSFTWNDKMARAEFTPSRLHQGWSGILHGGIIACLLDEAMNYAPYFEGITTITAKMQTRIKKLTSIGESLILTSKITKKNRKLVEGEAVLALEDGTIVAESTATMFIFKSKQTNNSQSERKA